MNMDSKLRVLIADDHPIFREGLVKTLERHDSIAIVGQAVNGMEALEKIRALIPDIAVLDVEMPGMNGIDVARAAYKEALLTSLIFLTMYKDPTYFNAALDLGVRGYLLKDSVIEDLVKCLTAVSDGQYYISPSMSHLLIERKKRSAALLNTVPALSLLTPAERTVLKLLADNLTSREIAEKLFVTPRTVENHRLHMSQKLEIKGHNKLLEFALKHRPEL